MKNKNLILTTIISTTLFLFIGFLIYTIYCYSFYDTNKEKEITKIYNNHEYEKLYNITIANNLSYEKFTKPLTIMYDLTNLKNIYKNYYKDSSITEEDFINTYYYGNNKITKEDIEFISTGKTNLIKRKQYNIKNIKVSNDTTNTLIGILNNINISIEDNTILTIDNNNISCNNNICSINNIFGGLHEITYKNNDITYYGIINLKSSNITLDITLLDNLIKIS